jgi:hypothetical protein
MTPPTHFKITPSSGARILRTRQFITAISLLAVLLSLFATFYAIGEADGFDDSDVQFYLIFLGAFAIASGTFLFRQRATSDFYVTHDGIVARHHLYPWSGLKHYHFFGDSQSERIGLISLSRLGWDPTNAYALADTKIARIHVHRSFHRFYLNLEIQDPATTSLEALLAYHDVVRDSELCLFVGLEL